MAKVNKDAPFLIDEYIVNAPDYAQPILNKLRALILVSSDKIVEDWKWGAPNFGHKGMVCWLAAFKNHVGINFLKGSLIEDKFGLFHEDEFEEKGNRMIRFTPETKIEAEKIIDYILQGIELNEKGIKVPIKKKELVIPDYINSLLDNNPKAKETFVNFPPSHKMEYVEWIEEAKREATKEKRMATMIEWLEEGKDRNWKYKK